MAAESCEFKGGVRKGSEVEAIKATEGLTNVSERRPRQTRG